MVTEARKRATQKYIDKLKGKGIRQHLFRCTDEQHTLLKAFFTIIKKIENLDTLTAIDVSDDMKSFKLIFKEKKK